MNILERAKTRAIISVFIMMFGIAVLGCVGAISIQDNEALDNYRREDNKKIYWQSSFW